MTQAIDDEVAALSGTTGRLAGRLGYRTVLVIGGLTFAASEILLAPWSPPRRPTCRAGCRSACSSASASP